LVGYRRAREDRERIGRTKPDRRWTCGICRRSGREHADRESDRDASRKQQPGAVNPCLHLAASLDVSCQSMIDLWNARWMVIRLENRRGFSLGWIWRRRNRSTF